MADAVPVPAAVAEQARAALAERSRTAGITGASRQAVMCAFELAQSPYVPDATLVLVGAWHAANPNATTADGRCTRLAGLYGGAAGKRWALDHAAIPTTSWLPEESATLEAMTAAPTHQGGMIALYPDNPTDYVVPGGEPAEELHVTLAYVAQDAAALVPEEVTVIEQAAAYGAGVRSAPLLLTVIGAGTLGDEQPAATVVFLQQSDGDGTDHEDGVTAVAAAVRAELNDYGSEAWPDEHDGFIPHMTVGYGTPVADAQALVGREIKFSEGPTVSLGDIRQPHAWMSGRTAATKAAPTANVTEAQARGAALEALTAATQRARRRLAERTYAAAQVTMRDALRRAGVKIVQRAAKRSQAAKAAVAAAQGRWTPAVLAAVGLTEQDALHQAFDTLGDRYEEWVKAANKEQLAAVAVALGLSADEVLKRLAPRAGEVAAASRARLQADLMEWAQRLLVEPEPSFGEIGEVPVDPTLPWSVLAGALLFATGQELSSAGRPQGEPIVIDAWRTFDASPPIEIVTWVHGDSARPFDAHEALDGLVSSWDDYDATFLTEGGFPYGIDSYYPGDHDGCSCSLESSWEHAAGDETADSETEAP